MTGTVSAGGTRHRIPALPAALLLLAAISGAGLALAQIFAARLPAAPPLAFFLFMSQESPAFAIMLVVAAGTGGFLLLRPIRGPAGRAWQPAQVRIIVGMLALAAGATALLGHYVVYHDHALSWDEFMTRFGEAIWLKGDLLARIPDAWRPYAEPLGSTFAFWAPADGLWGSPYRPVTAAEHALFALVLGTDALANPALTALAVILAAAVARRLWPGRADAALLAAILVATSPQVVITGMTLFAMPGHLAFNLLWLWLFLRGGRLGHGLAAATGALAVGLHQINFHPFFVLPFLIPLLFGPRWKLALFYGAAYAAACLFWLNWYEFALWMTGVPRAGNLRNGGGGNFLRNILDIISVPDLFTATATITNLLRFLSWNNLALLPLVMAGVSRRSATPILSQCAWGIGLTVAAFALVLPSQGIGWGYRYLHGFIGNAVLLAVGGWVNLTEAGLAEAAGARLAARVLTLATLCLLALRCLQVESFVAPAARALAALRASPAQVVVIDNSRIWYGATLAQNDPYLRNSPKIMALTRLDPATIARLCPLHPAVFGPEELARAGAPPPDWFRFEGEGFDEVRKALRACAQAAVHGAETDRVSNVP